MAAEESVSEWIALAKFGENSAAAQLYHRYYERLLDYARPRMNQRYRPVACEEDIAQSVLRVFCEGARRGSFKNVHNRDDLWAMLIRITVHKIIDYHRRYGRHRKRACEVRASDLPNSERRDWRTSFEDQYVVEMLEPSMIADLQEVFQNLLQSLRCDESRQIALMRLQGNSIQEIAQTISKSTRSVERKLRSIRDRWAESLANEC